MVTGSTLPTGLTAENIIAFVSAFVGIAMWWIYFTGRGGRLRDDLEIRQSGRLARLAYTYLHLPIVAGIILSAVADESC